MAKHDGAENGKKPMSKRLVLGIVLAFVSLASLIYGITSPVKETTPYIIFFVSLLALLVLLISMIVSAVKEALLRHKGVSLPHESNAPHVSAQAAGTDNGDYMDFGFYEPKYKFMDAKEYVDRLKQVRDQQKNLVRTKKACCFPTNFTYNGSIKQGAAVINDWIKLMLRAFNGECEAIISKVRFDNMPSMTDKIYRSAASINAIGSRMQVQITDTYVAQKIEELTVAYEYELFKEQEKERMRQIREEEREKAKVEKELRDKMAKLDKDLQHIQNEKDALQAKLDAAGEDEDITSIQFELDKLINREQEIESEKDDIAEREVNARAGYVYIISNIGSFGENVYKIGMTRRLDPQERIDELGSASVPFTFDVHAFIFSTDAVALETALHHRFEMERVNQVNPRKEFFAVTLDEIEEEVRRNYNGTVEFHRTAAAVEYYESLAIRQRRNA